MTPTDLTTVHYHAEDRLPADAVALVEPSDGRVDVYLSRAYPLDVLAAHLGPLLTIYVQAYRVEQDLALVV